MRKRENILRNTFFTDRILLLAMTTCMFSLQLRAQSQAVAIPKNEFQLYMPVTTLDIERGDTLSFEIFILKSRPYQKSKVEMGVSSNLPAGLLVHFLPSQGHIEKSVVQIIAGMDTVRGEYHIIINSAIRYHTKGIILKLNVL
jgi:hypothetical protein